MLQGSILGPILFNIFVSELHNLIANCSLQVHFYVDDSQLYISCPPDDAPSIMQRLADCIAKVDLWLHANRLLLNPGKTDLICLGSRQQVSRIPTDSITFGATVVNRARSVRNLGLFLDENLTMSSHVSHIVRCGFYQLRQLRTVVDSLSAEASAVLVHAFISSRLDYCNSLLVGISAHLIRRLQVLQNAAARLIAGARRYDHITPILQSLHWLPVRERILYKVSMLVHRCLSGNAPQYLTTLLNPLRNSTRPWSLRSNATNQLITPRTRTNLGARAFSVAGPTIWNSLPSAIRDHQGPISSFAKLLKSHLYASAAAAHS